MDRTILSRISSPDDLKRLSEWELPLLARELRERIIEVVSTNGGHLSSNLGVVELTIALHRVFSSPYDAIIWDVGHQCYAHKLLTGRDGRFETLRKAGGISGFPKRAESVHDIIETGHASTSISAGLGLLAGRRLSGHKGKVVSVIGDGALSGGLALEALNHAGQMQKDLIVILNDNEMSISRNTGALSAYLSRITAGTFYQQFRDRIDKGLKEVPLVGDGLYDAVVRFKKGLKAVLFKENIFSDLGFEYVGPIDGHNIFELIEVLQDVKRLEKPVVVHVLTRKGKGYSKAEIDPTSYHGVSPHTFVDGKLERKGYLSFTEVFSEYMTQKGREDGRVTAVCAAMAIGTGLESFKEAFPERFFDVGIAEEHAVTFAAGLAAAGMKPIVALYSTFAQRTVDQVIHDVAIPALPVVCAFDRAGLVGNDGETHQGVFDVSLFLSVPGVEILSPATAFDLKLMLDYAFSSGRPTIVRFPKDICPDVSDEPQDPLVVGRGSFFKKSGSRMLLITDGGCFWESYSACSELLKRGISVDLYSLRFLKPLDEEYLASVLSGYSSVFCIEDGVELGGIGEYISSLVQRRHIRVSFSYRGVPDQFVPQGSRKECLSAC
ncbi:MAG TPA: 1-deoxy-D-xylulose-5-phosphate synthase, partial [Spirochaetia bacterium]|nr:1-deoxy-D-xylulose-5-phosphate synthase [Spirochaetia bacterium]